MIGGIVALTLLFTFPPLGAVLTAILLIRAAQRRAGEATERHGRRMAAMLVPPRRSWLRVEDYEDA